MTRFPPVVIALVLVVPQLQADWPCLGGGPSRNPVNLVDRNLPETWEARAGKPRQNVKWVAPLGSRSHAGPVVAGGRIFVGTNNDAPRNPVNKPPDKGV